MKIFPFFHNLVILLFSDYMNCNFYDSLVIRLRVFQYCPTRDKQIRLPLRGRVILLPRVWLQTELDSTQSYYHHQYNDLRVSSKALQVPYPLGSNNYQAMLL